MQTRPAVAYTTLAAATLLVAFLLHYPSLFEPRWYGDEGIFASVAESLRHGRMLYSGSWDNKPPLIYFTYAGIQAAFGTGMFPLHLVAVPARLEQRGVAQHEGERERRRDEERRDGATTEQARNRTLIWAGRERALFGDPHSLCSFGATSLRPSFPGEPDDRHASAECEECPCGMRDE